jgi:GT2 family glycosyltransferase
VRLLDNPGRRSSSGRNVGFRAARGDVVVVVDGHVHIPDDQLFKNLVRCFRVSGAACLGRPQPLLAAEPGTWAAAIAAARSSPLGHHPGSLIYSDHEGFARAASMGAAYRPWVFDRIGYVDESFDACEDLEFNTRLDAAGLDCFTSPTLAVHYYARESLGGLFRQLRRYGFGRFRYLLRHPRTLSAGQLAPPLFVLGAASLPVLPLLPEGAFLIGLIGAAAYGSAVLAASLSLARRHSWRELPRYLAVFPTIHVATGIGFLEALARGGRPGHPPGGPR